jgi:hypothetical protein
MSLRLALLSALVGPVLAGAACSGSPAKTAAAGDSSTQTATPPAPAPGPAAAPAGATADPDQTVAGNGVPAGFIGRTDEAGTPISGAKYSAAANGTWEVQTGPAHILYSPSLVAHKHYTVTARIDQLEAPHHPEAYGIFIGGQQLDGPGQQYTYFLVRGDGNFSVKVRDGDNARTVLPFTRSPAVPQADASGKASYTLRATVTDDRARFYVNDQLVATVNKSAVPTDGIAGVRINHNLHVIVTPASLAGSPA